MKKEPVTPETSPLATTQELAARAQTAEDINEARRREEVAQRKRNQRARENAAKRLHERSKSRAEMWQENREALTPSEIADLEARQAEFAYLAYMVKEVTDNLAPDSEIGPPEGLPFFDVLFVEVQEHLDKTNPINPRVRRIVWHPSPAEFSELHLPDNKNLLDMFSSADPEWFSYGYYTRFQDGVVDEFVRVVADFIRQNPNHPEIDSDIAASILAERAKREPRRPVQAAVRNTPEDYRTPNGSEPEWVERQLQRERMQSLRAMHAQDSRDINISRRKY